MARQVVIAQSGGPSPVINNSLRGVIEGCRAYPQTFGRLYGGWHGIEGILQEELLDLSAQPQREIDLLAHTPAAGAIGTCRYKINDAGSPDIARVLDVFAAHDVGTFFYIGGNDSMDTADKLSRAAAARGLDLVCVGVPKTIDNDVGDPDFKLVDHTPGYGSVARYWACMAQNMNEENAGFSPAGPVLVMQAMGRTAGFIPAAARLADPERRWPMHLYLTESGLTLDDLVERVNDELRRSKRCLVVVSEGFEVGDLGARRDAFGHIEYAASRTTVAQEVINRLHDVGLAARGWANGQIAGCDQRSMAVYASTVDLEEAFAVGRHAVVVAKERGTGWMATILREPGARYQARYSQVPLPEVANFHRHLPPAWLAPHGIDVTDDFIRYARPLIGDEWAPVPLENGLQRFARLEPRFVARKLPAYVPASWR
ncbi:MAG: diphosphate--fructose-6-phosphate 1-phosphotransferase [Lentisphaerae bacterium]|nr:diphosphate--fructose-6-phosphate 1-phosphotransferase [Lentisphaerota bacterium]